MKLHLPLFLRKAILTLMLAYGVPAVQAAGLTLGAGDSLSLDFADASTIQNLNSGTLQLSGGTLLELINCGSGDGKTYTLATGVSSLLDAEGNALTLNSTNNAISNYFDTTQPGTGFWADASLVLSNGDLQLVRHNESVKAAVIITTRQIGGVDYQYYEGVSFADIGYSTSSSDAEGGAIYGDWGCTITLSDNGSVSFSGNTASGSYFASGGAIYGDSSSTITLSDNGSVTFSGNTASGKYARGGAIYGYGDITLSNNGSVEFSGNTASSSISAYGGAIYGNDESTITLSNNGSVVFEGNTASTTGYSASGGAIDGSTITLSDNGSVLFSGNDASSGGAIYGEYYSTITLSNNGSVAFSGNTASSGSYYARGGAIYGYYSTITLSNNGSVEFSGNTVSSGSSYAYGGAIYTYGNLSIQNNDSVLFEKNAEISNGTYRLRSIYAYGDSGDVISLSAAAGKSIEFRDAVFIVSGSTVNLNADYGDVKQQGDIVFTGKYTEQHLNELLDAAESGRTATAEEILNSRTTGVYTMTNLYGGRLCVEDGAVYKGRGITAMEGSEATVRVKDATLSHSGYDLTFNAGTTLELEGNNTIAGNVQMLEGSTLLLNAAEKVGLSEIFGNLNLAVGITLNLGDGCTGENEMLLYVSGAWSGWNTNSLTVTGAAAYGDVSLVDNLLILNYNAETFNRYFNGTVSYASRCAGQDVLKHHYESVSYEDISSASSGGAIYDSTITLSHNGSVEFIGNTAAVSSAETSEESVCTSGGAIDVYDDITLSHNGSVVFEGNTASSCDDYAFGGAISGDTVALSNNGSVVFEGNTASGSEAAFGGAIYGSEDITLSNNGSVVFEGNSASSTDYSASGGAIYGDGDITLSNNGSVEFIGNTSSGSSAYGGAIYGDGDITLSNNGSVVFSGNTASGSYDAYGGAIYGDDITLSNNGSVEFVGNTVILTEEPYCYGFRGGAIRAYDNLSICNNDSVLFEKNAEVEDGTYRLRSIYAAFGEDGGISFSAAAGKSIEFRDSICIANGVLKLNEQYENIPQTGDIIFTGAYTEAHLQEVKNGIAGTAEEIGESRTSAVSGEIQLYGGRMRVEDGAVFCGRNISAVEGSGSVIRVKNATLSLANYGVFESEEESSAQSPELMLHSSTSLELAGSSTLIGNTQLKEGSSLKLIQGEDAECLSIAGNIELAEGAAVSLNPQTGSGENNVLLYVNGQVSGWTDKIVSVNGYSNADVSWVDELLVLNHNASTFNRYFNGYLDAAEGIYGPVCLHHHELVRLSNLRGGEKSDGGAAIKGGGAAAAAVLSHNKYVSITGNEVTSSKWRLLGGAICVDGEASFYEDAYSLSTGDNTRKYDVLLDSNGTVKFAENKLVGTKSDYIYIEGGAIYCSGGVVISNNDNVVFHANSASLSTDDSDSEGGVSGGAIVTERLTLKDNGSVSFTCNSISGYVGECGGGAILSHSGFDIQNNDLVLFEKNVEISQGEEEPFYRLRGLFTGWNDSAECYLSAPEGGNVVFKDSATIHSGDLYMNADYVDAQGKVHKQSGDIVFTGASTESDLLAVKGSAGTEEEISLSRSSEIRCSTYLCGGRLRVEDGASLEVDSISAIEESKAIVRLRNASISAYYMSFERSTGLELKGRNESSGNLYMEDGSEMMFHIGALNLNSSLLTHTGSLTLSGALNILIDKADSQLHSGLYKLLTVSGNVDGWNADELVINGSSLPVSSLSWVDDTLFFLYTGQSLSMMSDEPEIPDTPVTPDEPEIPDTPVTPDEPEIPDTPVTPDEPEIPDTPVTPDEPEIPDTPVTPDEPEIPDTPVTPDEPEIPDTPVTPDEPEIPDTPVTPGNPEIPDTPVTPDDPEKPEPLKPVKPSRPVLAGGEIDKTHEVVLTGKGSLTLEGKVNAGAISVNIDKNLTFKSDKKKGGSLTGDGNLTKSGKGTLTLNDGNGSWMGDIYLQAGTIKVKGVTSLGKGDVYVQGGTLNLGSKAIANDIIQSGNATIKSGKKFTGTYTLENGELLKGSTLNINRTATLAGGKVNGTLSGSGKTVVTGKVTLGDKGKITTKYLNLDEGSSLTTSAKGLNSKATTITIDEDAMLTLAGKLTADSLKLNGGDLKTTGAKAAAVTVKQNLTIASGSNLSLRGKLSVGSLSLKSGGTLTLSGSKPVTLKVKGALTLNSGSSIILDYNFAQGKTYKLLTFASCSGFSSIDLYDIFGMDANACSLSNTGKAITLTVTGNLYSHGKKAVTADATVVTPPKDNPVADALVQANWGQLEASRAFVNAMANRSNATALGNGERAVWASAIGSSSRHSSAGGHNGADTNVSGGVFGLETQVGRASLFGMALGNSWTRVSAHGFGTIEQDTTHLGLYGQSNWRSGISADWSAAYGRSESETMGSDWNQKHLQLDGRVSYNHELNASTVLSPFAGLQYYASDSASVDGTSTGSLQNLRAEIGVAASRRTGKLGVFGEIAVHQDIARNNPSVSMEGNRYTGMNPGRTGLNFTIGASYELTEKWSVNASYTGEFVENANAHSANVGATYKF